MKNNITQHYQYYDNLMQDEKKVSYITSNFVQCGMLVALIDIMGLLLIKSKVDETQKDTQKEETMKKFLLNLSSCVIIFFLWLHVVVIAILFCTHRMISNNTSIYDTDYRTY